MTAYFERIFFQNPWVDADLPSLVYEDETGRVGGFVGVVPRRMLFLGAREEPTHQPAPDLPTVPGGHHQLSRDGHTDRLAPEQHATRHYPNEPAHPPPLVFLHERREIRAHPGVLEEDPLKVSGHPVPPDALSSLEGLFAGHNQ